MSARILVAYSRNRGGRDEAAARVVAQVLSDAGAEVALAPLGELASAASYDSTVVVAPLVQRIWSAEAADFLRLHRLSLANQSVAFLVTGQPEGEARDEAALLRRGLAPVLKRYNEIRPVAVGLVRGERSQAGQDAVRAWAEALVPNFVDEDGSSPAGTRRFLDPSNPSSGPGAPLPEWV